MSKIKRRMFEQPTRRRQVVREPESEKSGPELNEGSLTPADAQDRLLAARLRATRPRVAILRLLVANGHRHVTPDAVWAEVRTACMRLSLATVYNNLNAFTEAGLLKRIVVGPREVFFDTDTRHHHHVYYEEGGELRSVAARPDGLVDMPDDLAHVEPQRLDVLVRVRAAQAKEKGGVP